MLFDNKQKDTSSWLRTIYDCTMGVLWLGVGIFFLFHRKWGYDLDIDPILTNIFGGAGVLYGLFRIYRGIKISKQ